MKLSNFALTGYTLAVVVGLGLLATYGAMEASSKPPFCGSCHIMKPYYESWKDSNHANIDCVDCHIPPGITAELRKKYEALSMVVRYFTATYGTNPWAEVEDTACLDCHERRLLVGQEMFGSVMFDHGPHLAELRRGKRLRCTSCHSQMVQGSHIAVTQTTCSLCHFMGQKAGEGTANCTLCHDVPDGVVQRGDAEFDHSSVSRFGMDCLSCHAPPRPGAGRVPKERCLTCHNEPERLERYDEGDELHRTHVTDHKVECTHCHLEIQHVTTSHGEQAPGDCSSCHANGHSPQSELYAGTGGRGVEPMPDVMHRAGVRCQGCHIDSDGHEGTRTAGEVSCMSCHGPGYRNLYLQWMESLNERSRTVRRQHDATAGRLRRGGDEALADAAANLRLVERGNGIHNYRFSMRLLKTAHEQINEARSQGGLPTLPAPWPLPPYESECFDCHEGIESQRVSYGGKMFPHESHVVRGELRCDSCHSTHEQRESEGAASLTISAGECQSCHHRPQSTCGNCHQSVLGATLTTTSGAFEHGRHISAAKLACRTCHGSGPQFTSPASGACDTCHHRPEADCDGCHGEVMESLFPVDLGEFDHSLHVGDMELGCDECHGEGPVYQGADLEVCGGCH